MFEIFCLTSVDSRLREEHEGRGGLSLKDEGINICSQMRVFSKYPAWVCVFGANTNVFV